MKEVKINVTSGMFFFSVEILSKKGDFPFRMCQRSLKQNKSNHLRICGTRKDAGVWRGSRGLFGDYFSLVPCLGR